MPGITFDDAWLIAGVRTPFVDYNGALAQTSPIDLGIKVARDVFARTGVSPRDVGTVIAGSMAQASFDATLAFIPACRPRSPPIRCSACAAQGLR